MIRIEHPVGYEAERKYIYGVIFNEFLGFEWASEQAVRENVKITHWSDDGKSLEIDDSFFEIAKEHWLKGDSLPKSPIERSQQLDNLPVIYGTKNADGTFINEMEDSIELGIDLFGSAFYMLTRYEESVITTRDEHDRFPATSSLAFNEGFLDEPIVDRYVELLWDLLKRLWPTLRRKEQEYTFILTHDVDHPAWVAGKSWGVVVKNAAGDLLRRRNPRLAARRLTARMKTGHAGTERDPGNTFDYIMDQSEKLGLKSAFYFIAERTAGDIDGYYSLEDLWIRHLLREIDRRGHEIGLHPSYNTYQDPEQIKNEFEILKATCGEEQIEPAEWGGRHHFLRWDVPTTWQAWHDAGLSYDSTGGFSDQIGFRCGTCHEFPVFNLRTRERLSLRERPLIVMDGTLFDHMKLPPDEALKRTIGLAESCKRHRGNFVLLWHNSELLFPDQREFYEAVVKGCA